MDSLRRAARPRIHLPRNRSGDVYVYMLGKIATASGATMNFENLDHMLVHFAQKLKVQIILILLEESPALSALDEKRENAFCALKENSLAGNRIKP